MCETAPSSSDAWRKCHRLIQVVTHLAALYFFITNFSWLPRSMRDTILHFCTHLPLYVMFVIVQTSPLLCLSRLFSRRARAVPPGIVDALLLVAMLPVPSVAILYFAGETVWQTLLAMCCINTVYLVGIALFNPAGLVLIAVFLIAYWMIRRKSR